MSRRLLSLEQVGGIALEWQQAVWAMKEARAVYYDKYRRYAKGRHVKRTDTEFEFIAKATSREWIAFEQAKADAYNARRRLERAARRCEQ